MGKAEEHDSPDCTEVDVAYEHTVNNDTRHRADTLGEVTRIRDIWVNSGYKGTPRIIKITTITETEELHV